MIKESKNYQKELEERERVVKFRNERHKHHSLNFADSVIEKERRNEDQRPS